jgi:hypothetical protein
MGKSQLPITPEFKCGGETGGNVGGRDWVFITRCRGTAEPVSVRGANPTHFSAITALFLRQLQPRFIVHSDARQASAEWEARRILAWGTAADGE